MRVLKCSLENYIPRVTSFYTVKLSHLIQIWNTSALKWTCGDKIPSTSPHDMTWHLSGHYSGLLHFSSNDRCANSLAIHCYLEKLLCLLLSRHTGWRVLTYKASLQKKSTPHLSHIVNETQ